MVEEEKQISMERAWKRILERYKLCEYYSCGYCIRLSSTYSHFAMVQTCHGQCIHFKERKTDGENVYQPRYTSTGRSLGR